MKNQGVKKNIIRAVAFLIACGVSYLNLELLGRSYLGAALGIFIYFFIEIVINYFWERSKDEKK